MRLSSERILTTHVGSMPRPPHLAEMLLRKDHGEPVDPARYYFRTVMRFETADPEASWLNRILAIARGERLAHAVKLDVYEVL